MLDDDAKILYKNVNFVDKSLIDVVDECIKGASVHPFLMIKHLYYIYDVPCIFYSTHHPLLFFYSFQEVMPEDANPGLKKNSLENYLYFTLPMALNYQRNSYTLWQALYNTFMFSLFITKIVFTISIHF